MPRVVWTGELLDRVGELLADGATFPEVGAELGMAADRVRVAWSRHRGGANPPGRPPDVGVRLAVLDLVRGGAVTTAAVARARGVSWVSSHLLLGRMRRAGLVRRVGREWRECGGWYRGT
jgi:hypothetical protein